MCKGSNMYQKQTLSSAPAANRSIIPSLIPQVNLLNVPLFPEDLTSFLNRNYTRPS